MNMWKVEKYTATQLTEKIRDGDIKVPPYQRGQVWSSNQEERLVDTIKKGFPFGSILLYEKKGGSFQIIDGLQRSTTIYKYLCNPAKFFREDDITDERLEAIFYLIEIGNANKAAVKVKIKDLIISWVTVNHKTMDEVSDIRSNKCAEVIANEFPTCSQESKSKIDDILHEMFKQFKNDCKKFSEVEIPAIIYYGSPENLPDIFSRINSKGTLLSKYQILAATWSHKEYLISEEKLTPIVSYVNKFYISIINENFKIDEYDCNQNTSKSLNLYQILFGFSKILSNQFPQLFAKSQRDKDVESSAFNLVNACLGNKNSKLSELPNILNDCFKTDEDFNLFLIRILEMTDFISKQLSGYLLFKLNSRDKNNCVYHTEMQICSIVSNAFVARYVAFNYDDKQNIIGRTIVLNSSNKSYDKFKHNFKNNMFKKYVIDILNNVWRGTGDSKLDEVSKNNHYYSKDIQIDEFENELDHWFQQTNNNRAEYLKVGNPTSADKILLSIIYSHSFTAFQQNNEMNYDIEHLATKAIMKSLLKPFNTDEEIKKLPISSFANLCLLVEEINRKKQDKTLYDDEKFLEALNGRFTLSQIEEEFSFTSKDDFIWLNSEFNDFEILNQMYHSFLGKRFEIQKKKILHNLYNS